MKKLIFFLLVVFLFSSCTVINEKYTGKRIKTEPEVYYEESPSYSYIPSFYYDPFYFYTPYYWTGFGWWDPFWYYGFTFSSLGFYNNYWGWRYGYSYYPYNYRYSSSRSVITKRQLQKRIPRGIVKSPERRISTTAKIRNIARSSAIRAGSARSAGSSSGGGSAAKVKKKD